MILDLLVYVVYGVMKIFILLFPSWNPIPAYVWSTLVDWGVSSFSILYDFGFPINTLFLATKYALQVFFFVVIPIKFFRLLISLIRGVRV